MALAFGFDEDMFEECRVRPKKPDQPYCAKQCEQLWFMNGSGASEDELQLLIFQGDVLFHQKQWQEALKSYLRGLELTPKRNSATQRLLLESVSRCYIHLSNGKLAEEYAAKLVTDSQNDDQRCVSQSLLATVYQKFDNPQGEILSLHQCVQYHPFNIHFWLRLAKAYLRLSEMSTSKMTPRQTEDGSKEVRTNSNQALQGDHHCVAVQERSGKGKETSRDNPNDATDVRTSNGACKTYSNGEKSSGALHTNKESKRTLGMGTSVCEASQTLKEVGADNISSATKSTQEDQENDDDPKKCVHPRTCDDASGCSCHSDGEGDSLSCVCALRTSLSSDESPTYSLLKKLYKNFAVGCLVRCSVLLSTVQQSVTSFAKHKNEQLKKEIETTLGNLQLDASTIQKVRQYSEDDVFGRGTKSEEAAEGTKSGGDKEESSNVEMLTREEFEQK